MQKPQSPRPGDLVLVRRSRWRVADVRGYENCALVTLHGSGRHQARVVRRVVAPFDVVEPIERRRRPRLIGSRGWWRACAAAIADERPARGLVAARTAAIDLLPYQLEPALTVVCGLATRLLLADEVGLGKTIQAALVVSELIARDAIDRVLVLTPAGLRDQWVDELSRRFAIEAMRVDPRMLRRAAIDLPIGVNPWSTIRIAIASIDYVKRPEVAPAVASVPWDLVVVDEAHIAAADSDRRVAAHALASSASYVLLLTATPHSGDRDLFASLCDVGAVDGTPLVVFRRTRSEVGVAGRRRVHVVRVRASAAERRMHSHLLRYATAVREERASRQSTETLLALGVLHKRMLSSAWSLAQSVERRLRSIAVEDDVDEPEQLTLPLAEGFGELTDADQPPAWPSTLRLADRDRERRLLTTLLSSAHDAAAAETKLRRLATLLRRSHERMVVFTEYRDTLLHVLRRIARPAIVLHGGLGREERADALQKFAATPSAVLLTTDAASEGLNLHHGCRSVVNLELPWNPSRLEQRIGRVDRIGQPLTVHAFHLIAATTGEDRVLDRLRSRIAVAESDIRAADPLSDRMHERAIARVLLRGESDDEDDAVESAGGSDA